MKEYKKANPMSRVDIRSMARNLRKLLDIEDQRKINVLWLIEYVLALFDPEFEEPYIVPDQELDVDAVACPSEHTIIIKKSVYEGARKGNGRDRFTIVHEFAHYILHDERTVSFARGGNKPMPYEDPEWQADAFAGEFLIPHYQISGMSINEIKDVYGVSYSAAKCHYNMKKDRA